MTDDRSMTALERAARAARAVLDRYCLSVPVGNRPCRLIDEERDVEMLVGTLEACEVKLAELQVVAALLSLRVPDEAAIEAVRSRMGGYIKRETVVAMQAILIDTILAEPTGETR